MLAILLRFLYVALGIWIFRRLLMAFQAPKKTGPPPAPPGADNAMVKDPVCGMYMDSRLAIRMENKNEPLFFCSEECRNRFLGKSAGSGTNSASVGQ
jgi:uncharacterized protein